MKATEKWICVDALFEKNYPALYKKITQLSEFAQYNGKGMAGISKAGNIKLLWNSCQQTVLLKKDLLLESASLYQDYLQYAANIRKTLPISGKERSRCEALFNGFEPKMQRHQQIKDFIQELIREHWDEIGRKAQDCVNTYFKKLSKKDNAITGTLHYNRYEDKKVCITVLYHDMTFNCERFSKRSIASFFRETAWVTSYQMNEKQGEGLADRTCIDWDAAIDAKLEKFVEKMKQALKEGIPLALSTQQVAYQRELQDRVQEYKKWWISWLDGSQPEMEEFVTGMFFIEKPEVIFTNGAGSITVNKNGSRYTASKQFKEYQIVKNIKLRERCKQYALEAFSKFGSIKCASKSVGILNGDTELTFQMDGIPSFSYLYRTAPYQQSVPEWKRIVNQNGKQIQMLAQATREKRKKELKKQYRAYLNSYLVRDVLECVARNETYITQNAVVQILRGTKVALNATINSSRGDGLYRLYSTEEVANTVAKMRYSGLLTAIEIKGTYGNFDILKIPSKIRLELKELNALIKDENECWTEKKQEEVRKKLRDGVRISDAEVEMFLSYEIQKEEKEISTYMNLINLISHPIVLTLHKMEVRNYFADAPEPVLKFLKLHYKNADTHEKKIIKQFFLFHESLHTSFASNKR